MNFSKSRNTPHPFIKIVLVTLSLFTLINLFNSCSSTKSKLTNGEKDSKTVLKLKPSENNPRNSEGDFISLKDGRILFIYSRYSGDSASDHAPASLAGRYSSDGGKTWTNEDEIIVTNEGGMNVMSVSLLRLQNGKIVLFYIKKNSNEDASPMMRISNDEAKTWSDPIQCITNKPGYFVLNNDRVIQLKNGRIILPVSRHNTPDSEWRNKGDLFCYYSDDNGNTWLSSTQVPDTTNITVQEPGLIEMSDGRIMMYARASDGFQMNSYSSDYGVTWNSIQNTTIPSPLSPASIEKIPATGDWLIVWNNNDGTKKSIGGKRTPLTMAISKDEGKTWENIKNIENNPEGWYCYTAIDFVGDQVLLSYCAGVRKKGASGSGLATTNITQIGLDWIYK
ncbi:sialidase family protein [Aurantibacter sp.]|uniref:sialidase family protein n=1 Tax=Aurantibacter sp. TaxID=2807103 RepID=UPI003265DD86